MSENKKTVNKRSGGHAKGGPMAGNTGEKATDFWGTMKRLSVTLRPFYLQIVVVFVFGILSAAFTIMGPYLIGKATTAISDGVIIGGIDFSLVAQICLSLVFIYALSLLFGVISGILMTQVSQKITYSMRKDISEKINKLPFKYFDGQTHGEILSRVTNDVDTVSSSLNQSLQQIVYSVTTVIGVFIMMLTINVFMTLIVLIVIPVSMIVVSFVVKYSQKYYKDQQDYLGHVNGMVEEIYGGHTIVQAFNAEEDSVTEFQEFSENLYKSAWKAQFFSGVMMPVMTVISNISYVVVCILGTLFTLRGIIQIGDILAFVQYVRNFTYPITQVAQIANVLQSTAAAAERVYEFLSEEDESADPVNALVPTNVNGSVEFKDVVFGYDPEKIVINDFSAKVSPGQKIAIVGHTGAGKSTIVKLLMNFYDLNSGGIYVDDVVTTKYSRDELRKLFGMVLQETWLFNGTIMENIRYGRMDATDEEVIAASKSAHAHSFIKTLPGGYNMMLDEEASNVSAGQKQLLTIARAMLANHKMLILDEATSSVDTRTEIRIQRAMDKLMMGRTSFIIAHRLSTIKNADLILVMEHGDIIEQGSHDELIALNGSYASLYNSQFEVEETA